MNGSADLNIVALSPNDWFGQWMNRQYLLSRVGRRHRVVYSMGAWTVWDRTTQPWKRAQVFGRTVPSDNVVVEEAPRFLLRWPTHTWIDNVALYLHAWRLRQLANLGGSG